MAVVEGASGRITEAIRQGPKATESKGSVSETEVEGLFGVLLTVVNPS